MRNLILLSLLFVAFPSCKKEPIVLTAEDHLTHHQWKLTSFIVRDEDGAEEMINEMESCELDNTLIFTKPNQFTIHEGDEICEEDESAIIEKGQYILSNDSKTLSIILEDEVTTFQILELTESILKMQVDESEEPGEIAICTMTFIPTDK